MKNEIMRQAVENLQKSQNYGLKSENSLLKSQKFEIRG